MNEKGGKSTSPIVWQIPRQRSSLFRPVPPPAPVFWYVVLVCFWRFPLKFHPTAWVGSRRGNERREFSGRLPYTSSRMQETG